VGNNVVNIAIASVLTVVVGSVLPPGPAVLVTTVVASVVVLLFGEIVPKSYGLGNARRWAVRTAPVVRVVELVLFPAIAAFDWLTRRVTARLGAETEIERPYLD
jgi:CBS domain containing-hemolysin-like protein